MRSGSGTTRTAALEAVVAVPAHPRRLSAPRASRELCLLSDPSVNNGFRSAPTPSTFLRCTANAHSWNRSMLKGETVNGFHKAQFVHKREPRELGRLVQLPPVDGLQVTSLPRSGRAEAVLIAARTICPTGAIGSRSCCPERTARADKLVQPQQGDRGNQHVSGAASFMYSLRVACP